MQNSIREILNHNGEVLKTTEEIKGEAMRFFQDFLTQKPSDYQGTSVNNIQHLMENIIQATDIVKDYHKDSISPRCAMKIDISKAFDSVQWDFLLNVLEDLNFPQKFIHWINLCISTTSFSVQVNG